MKDFAIIILQLILPFCLFAQYDYLDIPIQKNGANSLVALAGGLNAPQFSAIDLNNNGTLDLLIYDRTAQIALAFLNNGTVNQIDYQYAPEYNNRFPQNTANFMLAVDFNFDGIEDLFYFARTTSYPSGGVALLQGGYDSSNKIVFTAIDSTLLYVAPSLQKIPIFIYNPDLPAFDDIDNDGDIDILAFSTNFGFTRNISWYKNMSVENGTGLNSTEFELIHECWGMVTETNNNNTLFLSPSIDSCPDNGFWIPPTMGSGPRHAGSTLTAIDYNNDGIKDMVTGDALINTLNLMTNSLVNDTFLVTSQDATYPSYDIAADILTFPAAFFLDVNNDGKKDMIASPNEIQVGQVITDSVAWYYENTVAAGVQLSFQQKDFLVGDMIDLGQDASPIFFDYNGDGLLDVLIGHLGYCQPNLNYTTGLTLLENTGTANAPSFTWITNNYANLDTMGVLGMHPTTADIDNDGDIDLLLGALGGSLIYIKNLAGPSTTAIWATPQRSYQSIDVGENSAPQWIDLDRDGDLDLAIGEFNGNINYFENIGSPTAPSYNTSPTTLGLSGFDVRTMNPSSRRSAPCFFDINGQYELYIGHQNGYPIHLKNIDNNILATYDTTSMGIQELWTGRFTDLDVGDINNDGRLDIVSGNNRGGISFFSVDTLTVDISYIVNESPYGIDRIFPNPAQDYLIVQLKKANVETLSFSIFNTLGQKMIHYNSSQQSLNHHLNISTLEPGIYILRPLLDRQRSFKFVVH
jgi:hypothetical protein